MELDYNLLNPKIENYLEKELKNNVTKNQVSINSVKKRYFNLLNLTELPSPRVRSDYLNPYKKESFSIDKAALSCEFYGSLGCKFLKRKKMPFNLNDFELQLASIYENFGTYDIAFKDICNKTPDILRTFRKTTSFLKNIGLESKIIKIE